MGAPHLKTMSGDLCTGHRVWEVDISRCPFYNMGITTPEARGSGMAFSLEQAPDVYPRPSQCSYLLITRLFRSQLPSLTGDQTLAPFHKHLVGVRVPF